MRVVRGDYPGVEDSGARGRKYFAFCGIGNPAAFRADLRAWGFEIVGHKFFPDHHHYTRLDVREIESEGRTAGANAILCTEKDIFNLTDAHAEAPEISYCRISLRIEQEDEFWQSIQAIAAAASVQ